MSKYRITYTNNDQVGGTGFPLRITTGVDAFEVSGFSQLMKLQGILKKNVGGDWFKISKHIKKYAESESFSRQGNNVLNVSPEEFAIIRKLAVSLKILSF